MVERAKQSRLAHRVIVATTADPKDDAIEALCMRRGYQCVRGSGDDVLGRYAQAARTFNSDVIVRVTADNPLVDPVEIDRLIDTLQREQLDYTSNHAADMPLGSGAEVCTRSALEHAAKEARDPYEREHVTPYIYRHPELFKQRTVEPIAKHPFAASARLTIDTMEDMNSVRALIAAMQCEHPSQLPSLHEILACLESHPEIVAMNKAVEQKTFPG